MLLMQKLTIKMFLILFFSKMHLDVKDYSAQIVKQPPRRCGAEIK